ncbi:DUF2867 domain-containing protein [Streptomyces sp. G-G2]|uniref:DUF2867 domain-containing protein n=1 Tax=Streptomyces sp. G-G2 TaxID=3046201 RepID=UPI0024BA1CB7|nr:DUF2867 domain-containing protein [Streptomyces sp. G-G2]MDJ0386252.1 DUF2867 domain-containing protein [Streptomyces sp. G-G2]
MHRPRTYAVPMPADSVPPRLLPRVDFSDAYAVRLPPHADTDPAEWAERIFRSPPAWIRYALGLRDTLVGVLGLKTNDLQAATPFPELDRTEREVVYGLDDRHLDFRAGIHLQRTDDGVQVAIITVVHHHNLFRRLYFLPVRWVHPLIIRSMLRRAAAEHRAP